MFEPKGGTAIALAASVVIAAVVFVAIAYVVIMVAVLAFIAIGYAIYFVIARPKEVPRILDTVGRTTLRYLSHWYLFLPLSTVGLVGGLLKGLSSTPSYPEYIPQPEWFIYSVMIGLIFGLLPDMVIGLIGNLIRGRGWGFVQPDWLYLVPPRIFATREAGIRFQAIQAAVSHCNKRMTELSEEHPEWQNALSCVQFDTHPSEEPYLAYMRVEWGDIVSDIPNAATLLSKLRDFSQVEITMMPMNKTYHRLLNVHVFGVVPGFSADNSDLLAMFRKDWRGEWRTV